LYFVQVDGIADMAGGAELVNKLNSLEIENKNLKKGQIIFMLVHSEDPITFARVSGWVLKTTYGIT
jgi:hypothetical protein